MTAFSLRATAGLVAGACLITLLIPTSVDAAGSALIRITDGKGPVAKVDPGGKLAVGDGSGPLTVNGSVGVTGRVDVSSLPPVSGSVDARPAPADDPWMNVNGTTLNGANPVSILYAGTVDKRLNLTTFSVSAVQNGPGSVSLHAQVLVGDGDDSCFNIGGGSFGAAERFTIVVPNGSTVVETFPSPLTWTEYGQGDDIFCVQVSGSGPAGWSASILANGFVG